MESVGDGGVAGSVVIVGSFVEDGIELVAVMEEITVAIGGSEVGVVGRAVVLLEGVNIGDVGVEEVAK